MVGRPEENGTVDGASCVADEFLERQLKGMIDQQLQELGFTDLCQKIAHKIVEKVQQIDEEHKEIKQMFSDIGARLDTLLADQENDIEPPEPPQRGPNERRTPKPTNSQSNKAVIVIDDEDEDDDIGSAKTVISDATVNSTSIDSTIQNSHVKTVPLLLMPSSPLRSSILPLSHTQTSDATRKYQPIAPMPPQNTTTKSLSIAQTQKSSGTKKIESVINNLKASKVIPTVPQCEPNDLNDLFVNNTIPQKAEEIAPVSTQQSDSEQYSTTTHVLMNNMPVVKKQADEKELEKIIIPAANISEEFNEKCDNDCPPELSKPPVKVNTPGECPPDISNSIFFPETSPVSSISPVVTPIKNSDIPEETKPVWFINDKCDNDFGEDLKKDPYMPMLIEGIDILGSKKDVDSDMPLLNEHKLDSHPVNPALHEFEDGFEEPLKSPVIVQTNTTSKLVTKIKLPEDFVHKESGDPVSPPAETTSRKGFVAPSTSLHSSKKKIKQSFQLDAGIVVFAKPEKSDIWYQAETLKVVPDTRKEKKVLVRFISGQKVQQKILLKNVALLDPPVSDEIEMGSRIVAGRPSDTVNSTISKKYKDINSGTNINVMFAGVVAEIACEANKNRYLVFFDDGYAQYISRSRMFPVLSPSKNVWDDVAVDCQEFIKEYLQEYPYRPLVCTKIGNTMQTEWNGSWWKSRVVAIDASLVKILFDIDKRSEWIYRGTTRLEPMYDHFIQPLPTTSRKKKKAKLQKEGSYVDEKITHPHFGSSKYSLKDPEGRQQRSEWGIAVPTALKIERISQGSPGAIMKPSVAEFLSDVQSPKEKLFSLDLHGTNSKCSSSTLGSESDSSKCSIESKLKTRKVRVQSDNESIHSEKDFEHETETEKNDMISSREVQGVLSALTMSPSGSDASIVSRRSLPNLPTLCSSPHSSDRSRTPYRDFFDLMDVSFVRNAREQGASYTAIAAHYKTLYPASSINRKTLARFCQIHNIHKRKDIDEEEDILKNFMTNKLHKKRNALKTSQSDDECARKITIKKSLSDEDLPSTVTPSSPSAMPATPPRLIKRGPHKCDEDCIEDKRDLFDQHRLGIYNYLAIPYQIGWKRESSKKQGSYHRDIYYRTPCNRRMRNLSDVTKYLLETKCKNVCIDMFCFQSNISCRNHTQKCKPPLVRIDDLSDGKETCPIVCINEVKDEYPPSVSYIGSRIKADDVSINTDPGFLVCCDCTDNCQDKTKCGCAQLTINSSNAIDNIISPTAGYQYRRLKEHLTTGIYECNQNCSCSRTTCYNRVVQNGIQLRLQVFMTENRGWGLRCVDDIPRGTFICTYAGQVLNEHTANREGMDFGDEYLAELDHIEVVEKAKDGYESDVPELRDSKKNFDDSSDDDSDSDSDSETSVMCISSDTTESSDEEVLLIEDDEPFPKRKKSDDESSRKQPSSDSVSTSTGSGEQSPAAAVVKMDETDVTPCHVPLQRILSADFPPRRVDSMSDDSFLTDDCSNLGESWEATLMSTFVGKQTENTIMSATAEATKEIPAENIVTITSMETSTVTKDLNNLLEKTDAEVVADGGGEPTNDASKTMPVAIKLDTVERNDKVPVKAVARKSTGQKAYAHKSTAASCVSGVETEGNCAEKTSDEKRVKEAKPKTPSTRLLYDGDNQMYIIDAKSFGNVGRYMNHSCSPNLFVQNVMVNTHDLRFPWVAFFAQQNIPAYTELTWDYNYEIGSVPGKELICKCGSRECKGRLL